MKGRDFHEKFMNLAIQQAWKAEPSNHAYSVGAILVHDNQILSTGFSREIPGNTHAEEVCLLKLSSSPPLHSCVLYSTMEPCTHRLSGKESCAERLIHSKLIHAVYVGVVEPKTFVQDCNGIQMLRNAHIRVEYLASFQGITLKFK